MSGLRNTGPQSFGFPRKIDTEDQRSQGTNQRWVLNEDIDILAGSAVVLDAVSTPVVPNEELSVNVANELSVYCFGIVPVDIVGNDHGVVVVEGPVYAIAAGATKGDALQSGAGGILVARVDQTFAVALEDSDATLAGYCLVYVL